jgi:hypothetical protein
MEISLHGRRQDNDGASSIVLIYRRCRRRRSIRLNRPVGRGTSNGSGSGSGQMRVASRLALHEVFSRLFLREDRGERVPSALTFHLARRSRRLLRGGHHEAHLAARAHEQVRGGRRSSCATTRGGVEGVLRGSIGAAGTTFRQGEETRHFPRQAVGVVVQVCRLVDAGVRVVRPQQLAPMPHSVQFGFQALELEAGVLGTERQVGGHSSSSSVVGSGAGAGGEGRRGDRSEYWRRGVRTRTTTAASAIIRRCRC